MSEPASQPGAPTDGAQNQPSHASEKSVAREAEKRLPKKAVSLLATPDRIILRLNKYAAPRMKADRLLTLTPGCWHLQAA